MKWAGHEAGLRRWAVTSLGQERGDRRRRGRLEPLTRILALEGRGDQITALALSLLAICWSAWPAAAQQPSSRGWAPNVVVPQSRAFTFGRAARVRIAGVAADVNIRDQVATTELEVRLQNPTAGRQEAELLVPVPDGAVVRGFTFRGAGRE